MPDLMSHVPPVAVDVPHTTTPQIDWGRVAMVCVSVIFGGLAVGKAFMLVWDGGDAVRNLAAVCSAALTALFYCLIVWAYLRRSRARATTHVTLALVAAPVATFLPFGLPHVGTGGAPAAAVVVGDLLLVVGLGWSIWALRCLDRSLSVIPQARVLVDHGPYRLVRHPLYLGEIVAMLGFALTLGGRLPLLGWAVLVALQCYRAVQEESLLSDFLPGYESYRRRTARVVPGLF